MLKLREDFNIKKLKFWGFKERKNEWYKDIDVQGHFSLRVRSNKEVVFDVWDLRGNLICGFPKEIFDLIKAEVLIWN